MGKVFFKIKRYGFENFCIFRDKTIIELQNNKVIMICGPNGTGKTTILDAIPFALYGITSKGLRGNDVVNDTVGKNCHVWVEFDIIENGIKEEFRVDRYQKHSKFGSTVILKNGNTIIRKGSKEYTPMIEALLLPQKLFFNSLFFGQKVKTFFTELTDSDQKEIFRKILKLDEYVDYYKNSNEVLSELDLKITKNENDIDRFNNIIEEYKNNIELLEIQRKNFEKQKLTDLEELQEKISKVRSDLDNICVVLEKHTEENFKNRINELREILNKTKEEITIISMEYKQIEEKIKSKYKEKENQLFFSFENKNNIFEQELSSIEKLYDKQYSELEIKKQEILYEIKNQIIKLSVKKDNILTTIRTTEDEKEEYNNSLITGDICPTCKQQISEECKIEMRQKLIEYENKIEKFKEKYTEITNEIASKEKLLSIKEEECNIELARILDAKKEKREEIKNNQQKLIEKKDLMYRNLNELMEKEIQDNKKDKLDKLNKLKKKEETTIEEILKNEKYIEKLQEYKLAEIKNKTLLDSLEKSFQEKQERSFNSSTLDHILEAKYKFEEKLKVLRQNRKDLLEEREIISFWKNAFSPRGIPSMLIDNSIPFMNKEINNYLEQLTNGRLIVSIDTLKETATGEFRDKISISVIDTATKANSRLKLSGGQIRQVDIATLLTLYKLQSEIYNMSFNVMIFDEIFDSLDDDNIGLASSVLKKLCKDACVFIISHRHISQIDADEILSFA